MTSTSHSRLVLAVYRGLQKWARVNAGIPVVFNSSDIYACAPEMKAVAFDFSDASAVGSIARKVFRSNRLLEAEAAADSLENGFLALRMLNTTYATQLQLMRDTRSDRSNRKGVRFDVGTVFMHKKFGYRGLVYGWDRECTRDEDWINEAGVNPHQPFYSVLPDEADCARLFGQPLSTRYVAQDNMMPLKGERILHRALNHYFTGHSEVLGRYIPSPKLQYEYPGKYSADDRDCVSADSNLLLHAEEEEGGEEGNANRPGYKSLNRGPGRWGEKEAII